jgi:4'-phosphopantetheinyl transferase EntD
MLIYSANIPFFYKKERIRCSLSVVCWNEEKIYDDLFNARLSAKELDRYRRMKSEKRKRQYAFGRISAKLALGYIDGVKKKSSAITIINSEMGNPIIENSKYCVSISHSGNYAASFVFPSDFFSFGIDIEHINARRMEALKFATQSTEPIKREIEDLTVAWCMKESLGKAMLCGFRESFESFAIKNMEFTNGKYIADYEHHPEYRSIALCDQNIAMAITYNSALTLAMSHI